MRQWERKNLLIKLNVFIQETWQQLYFFILLADVNSLKAIQVSFCLFMSWNKPFFWTQVNLTHQQVWNTCWNFSFWYSLSPRKNKTYANQTFLKGVIKQQKWIWHCLLWKKTPLGKKKRIGVFHLLNTKIWKSFFFLTIETWASVYCASFISPCFLT